MERRSSIAMATAATAMAAHSSFGGGGLAPRSEATAPHRGSRRRPATHGAPSSPAIFGRASCVRAAAGRPAPKNPNSLDRSRSCTVGKPTATRSRWDHREPPRTFCQAPADENSPRNPGKEQGGGEPWASEFGGARSKRFNGVGQESEPPSQTLRIPLRAWASSEVNGSATVSIPAAVGSVLSSRAQAAPYPGGGLASP